MNFSDTPLFLRTLAKQAGHGKEASSRERLLQALLVFRERAAMLANEIHRDLPDFTVHDVTHIDALWEITDLIIGPEYPLNPIEAFALGATFLLHDLGLGLAAWPGGLAELQGGLAWQDTLSVHLRKHLGQVPTPEELASPPQEVERAAIQERLRARHAEHAEQLALASWNDPKGGATYYLIDDPELRQTLGPILGRIAHSHWWPVTRLASEFSTIIGALNNCPADWLLDPLKVAVLLRTADAAHLDSRRAPPFLRVLRRPEGASMNHWMFQGHLLKPRVEDDRLVYTTARPFHPDEVDAWWLCEETLRMVDRELHQVDSLLSDLRRPRLRARGVAGVDSPHRLREYIKVSGWLPIDARIHVSNVADLVRRLGGEGLYGREPLAPLRELIQNASDAVRARRILEDRGDKWGKVTVRLGQDEHGTWAEVEDTGIGMSEAVLAGPLLDFGTTYWGSSLMREEHEGLWAKGFEPTGRFGIGFFSVFMWGHRVRVTTRRYEDAQRDTRVLEFRTGLETRPLLRPAHREEQLMDGGTRVRIWLRIEPNEQGGLRRPWRHPYGGEDEAVDLGELCAWLAPALDVDLWVEDEEGTRQVVTASDWLTMEGVELFSRISLKHLGWRKEVYPFGSLLRLINGPDRRPLGRAAIFETGGTGELGYLRRSLGVITVGGLRAHEIDGIAGVLVGSAERAARDWAVPLASDADLADWATEQATLISESISNPRLQMTCLASVLAYGGKPGELPITKRGEKFINCNTLAQWDTAPDKILLYRFGLSYFTIADEDIALHPHVLGVYNLMRLHHIRTESSRNTEDLIQGALAQAWGCPPEEILVSRPFGDYEVGLRGGKPWMSRDVVIIQKPKIRP